MLLVFDHIFTGNNTCVNRTVLNDLLYFASQDSELVYYIVNNKSHLDRWDFSGAFGFSISVVTTIGKHLKLKGKNPVWI